MKKILIYFLPLLLLCSCANDDIGVSNTPDDSGGVKAGFSLKVDNSALSLTRSSSGVDSTTIKNVWIVQFTYTADGTGGLLGTPQYLDASTDFNSSNMEVKLKEATSNIYFVANTCNSAVFNTGNCSTETAFKNLYKTFTTDSVMQNQLVNVNKVVPMTGVLTNQAVSASAALHVSPVNMVRALALVDFHYEVDFTEGGFTVTHIRVCNVPKYMYYVQHATSDFTSTDYYDYPVDTIKTADGKSGDILFYMPENFCGDGNANTDPYKKTGITNKMCTYIEIRGNSDDGKHGVYRFYIGKDDTKNYDVERNCRYKFNITLNALSPYDYRLSSGTIVAEANSYMVAPGRMICIPVSQAQKGYDFLIAKNTMTAGTKAIPKGKKWTAEMLWTDNSNGLSSNGAIESVKADPAGGYLWIKAGNKMGNGVVCIKVDGTIVWSWHLWVTDYVPKTTAADSNAGTTYSYNSYIWMDRNLGAASETLIGKDYGFLYQFGRKDPFTQADGTGTNTVIPIYGPSGGAPLAEGTGSADGINLVSGPTAVLNGIKNPMTLYYNATSPNNWSNTNSWTSYWGGDLYNAVYAGKAPFDPCPPGWHVPAFVNSFSPWTGLNTSVGFYNPVNPAWDFRAIGAGFYPACGYRGMGSGGNGNEGGETYYWSANSYRDANNLYWGGAWQFNTTSVFDVFVSTPSARSYPVRCVQGN